jgi:hypothetical protein
MDFLELVRPVNLRTKVPIATAVNFNIGDCLKILAYHDELHIGQAKRVLRGHNMAGEDKVDGRNHQS